MKLYKNCNFFLLLKFLVDTYPTWVNWLLEQVLTFSNNSTKVQKSPLDILSPLMARQAFQRYPGISSTSQADLIYGLPLHELPTFHVGIVIQGDLIANRVRPIRLL